MAQWSQILSQRREWPSGPASILGHDGGGALPSKYSSPRSLPPEMGVLPYQRISSWLSLPALPSPPLPSPPLPSPLLLLLRVLISIPHPVSLVLLLGAANCESRLHSREAGQGRHFMLTAGGPPTRPYNWPPPCMEREHWHFPMKARRSLSDI